MDLENHKNSSSEDLESSFSESDSEGSNVSGIASPLIEFGYLSQPQITFQVPDTSSKIKSIPAKKVLSIVFSPFTLL